MTRVSFQVPGGDVDVHDFDFATLTNQDYIHIETVTGMDVQSFDTAARALNATAWTALVQLMWKRQGRDVRFGDVEFVLGSLDFVDEDDPAEPAAEGSADPN